MRTLCGGVCACVGVQPWGADSTNFEFSLPNAQLPTALTTQIRIAARSAHRTKLPAPTPFPPSHLLTPPPPSRTPAALAPRERAGSSPPQHRERGRNNAREHSATKAVIDRHFETIARLFREGKALEEDVVNM